MPQLQRRLPSRRRTSLLQRLRHQLPLLLRLQQRSLLRRRRPLRRKQQQRRSQQLLKLPLQWSRL
jgi:hypothetical protein